MDKFIDVTTTDKIDLSVSVDQLYFIFKQPLAKDFFLGVNEMVLKIASPSFDVVCTLIPDTVQLNTPEGTPAFLNQNVKPIFISRVFDKESREILGHALLKYPGGVKIVIQDTPLNVKQAFLKSRIQI